MLSLELQQSSPNHLDVELTCESGELLALVGPSGAGKSSVLRCIAGLHKAQSGRIECKGQVWLDTANSVFLSPQQRRVGMVFQNYALFPHLNVAQNIALAFDEQSSKTEQGKRLLEQVHLSGLENRYPHQLSGGQQQRVALARALARQPQVLLLDEPFSAVDKVTRRKLYMELNTLRRGLEMPIILVTHDLDEAAMLADSMSVIHHGQTLQQGTPEQVLHQPDNSAVANQVDIRNLFAGILIKEKGITYLQWQDASFKIVQTEGFAVGQAVFWTISPAKVLLHQRVRPSRGENENPVTGIIREMITLRGITTVLLDVGQRSALTLQMDLPEHVAIRNSLKLGDEITVSILSEAIHLMAH